MIIPTLTCDGCGKVVEYEHPTEPFNWYKIDSHGTVDDKHMLWEDVHVCSLACMRVWIDKQGNK